MKKGILLIAFYFCAIVSFAQNSSFLKIIKFDEDQFKLGSKLKRIETLLQEPTALPFSVERSEGIFYTAALDFNRNLV